MWKRVTQKITISDLECDDSDVDPTYIRNREEVLQSVLNEKQAESIQCNKPRRSNQYPDGTDSVCLQSTGWTEKLINKEVTKLTKIDYQKEVAERRENKRKVREETEKEKKQKEEERKIRQDLRAKEKEEQLQRKEQDKKRKLEEKEKIKQMEQKRKEDEKRRKQEEAEKEKKKKEEVRKKKQDERTRKNLEVTERRQEKIHSKGNTSSLEKIGNWKPPFKQI